MAINNNRIKRVNLSIASSLASHLFCLHFFEGSRMAVTRCLKGKKLLPSILLGSNPGSRGFEFKCSYGALGCIDC